MYMLTYACISRHVRLSLFVLVLTVYNPASPVQEGLPLPKLNVEPTRQGAPPVTFAHTYRGLGWLAEARKPKKFLGVTDSYHAIFNTENVGETSRLVGSAGWVGERGPCGSGAVCRHMLSQGKPQAVFCFSHAHSAPLQTLFAVCLVSN